MRTIILQGGLANKMFEYAFGYGLSKKGIECFINETAFSPRMSHEELLLNDVFPALSLKRDEKKTFLRSILWKKNRFGFYSKKLFSQFPDYKLIMEEKYGYDPNIIEKLTKHCDILGLWQSEKYFSDFRDEILNEFSFPPFDNEKDIICSKNILSTNSVSIHIRKGNDYKKFGMTNGTCPVSYYINAINYIKERVSDPQFYIFTDNVEWVRENLSGVEATICNWNPLNGNDSYRDMQLMSLCKHNIIANSTYSWWGAWLNNNNDKIVIAPKKWFNKLIGFYNDLADNVPSSWIRL